MSLHDFSGILSLSMLFGLLLTIFYKRNFKFNVHLRCRMRHIVCLSLAWGLVYLTGHTAFKVFVASGTLYYMWKGLQDLAIEEKVKCLVLGTSLILVYFWESQTLTCLSIFFALTQLLRWPARLKKLLREPRIICGPVYTIFTIGSCVQSNPTSISLCMAAFLSLLASVFIRPDNDEVLKVLKCSGSIPTQQKRKMSHGFCMFASFISCFVSFVTTSAMGELIFCILCVIAFVNILMYIFVAEFPRCAVKWLWNYLAPRVNRQL